jgi:hypothetical protein
MLGVSRSMGEHAFALHFYPEIASIQALALWSGFELVLLRLYQCCDSYSRDSRDILVNPELSQKSQLSLSQAGAGESSSQTWCDFKGVFSPRSLPLFHGSRCVSVLMS